MKKPDIKRLKYPLWFRISFFVLTIIVPMILIMIEGYQSPSTTFKWTFGVITSLVILFAFTKHFVLSKLEHDWRDRQNKLEHDYEIDVGNPEKIKWLWFSFEQKLAIFDAINVGLCGGLVVIIATAVATQLMAIRGAILAIAICYVVAYIVKFVVITTLKGGDKNEPTEPTK